MFSFEQVYRLVMSILEQKAKYKAASVKDKSVWEKKLERKKLQSLKLSSHIVNFKRKVTNILNEKKTVCFCFNFLIKCFNDKK